MDYSALKEQQRQCEKICKYNNIEESAEHEVYKQLCKKNINIQLEMGICKNDILQNKYNNTTELLELRKRNRSQNYYVFVTFNFKEDITIQDASTFIDKIISKDWINQYAYCYEQRGELLENVGKGLHMHMLIQRDNKKPCQVIRELYSTFKKYTGYSLEQFKNPKNRNVCFIPYSWGKDKIAYMSGEKDDEEKQLKIVMDKVMRERNNLERIYGTMIKQQGPPCEIQDDY